MYILLRHLSIFNLDLVWDGRKVVACRMGGRNTQVIEEHEASGLATATEIMRDLEESYHEACCAM